MSTEVQYNGYVQWENEVGQPHRDEADGPAIEWASGTQEWYLNGKRHREGGPAVTHHPNGAVEYWVDGKRHREDGPACIWADGTEEYWVNNEKVETP